MRKRAILSLAIVSVLMLMVATDAAVASSDILGALARGDWDYVLKTGRQEKTVNFAMWSGDRVTNSWVDGYLANLAKEKYGITLRRVPMDAREFVNKIVAEKQAKVSDVGGTIDLLWVNGENFKTLKEVGGLFGPYAYDLPTFKAHLKPNQPDVMYDFGYPIEGYESPYCKAQFTFFYNAKYVKEPFKNLSELAAWVKANPGRFTYPMPPDFTGTTFIKTMFYATTGGYEQWQGDFKSDLYGKKVGQTWDFLKGIEPYLWRKGATYPSSKAMMDELYAQGEIWWTMSYGPLDAKSLIADGRFPESTRPVIFEDGSLSNSNFVAIPYNAPRKAAALLVADLLCSPEVQLHKFDPENWGALMFYDVSKVSPELKRKVAEVEGRMGPSVPGSAVMSKYAVPEPHVDYTMALEKDWVDNVLRKRK